MLINTIRCSPVVGVLASASILGLGSAAAQTIGFESGGGYTAGVALTGQGSPISWVGSAEPFFVEAGVGVGGSAGVRSQLLNGFAFANTRFVPGAMFPGGGANDGTGIVRTALDLRVAPGATLASSPTSAQAVVLRAGRLDPDGGGPVGEQNIGRINLFEDGRITIGTSSGEVIVVDGGGSALVLTPGTFVQIEVYADLDTLEQVVVVDGVIQGTLPLASDFSGTGIPSYGVFAFRYGNSAGTDPAAVPYDFDNLEIGTVSSFPMPAVSSAVGFEAGEGYTLGGTLSGQGAPIAWSGSSSVGEIAAAAARTGMQGVEVAQDFNPALSFQNVRFVPTEASLNGIEDGTHTVRTQFYFRQDTPIDTSDGLDGEPGTADDPASQIVQVYRIGRIDPDGAGGLGVENAGRVQVAGDGRVQYIGGLGAPGSNFGADMVDGNGAVVTIVSGEWNEVIVDLDYAADTQTVTFNGVVQNNGISFPFIDSRNLDSYGLFAIRYGNDNVTQSEQFSFDDLTIEIVQPEACNGLDIAAPFGEIDAFDLTEILIIFGDGCSGVFPPQP
ncbi:MAG: hypothetical protein AAGI30_01080 [Planctomycetota bacterium]